MRKVFTASAFALFGLAAVSANAMPFPWLNDGPSGVTPIAYGCGPGFTRGPYGGCHAMGGYGAYGYHPYARPHAHAYGYGYHPYAHRYGYHPYYHRY